MKVYEVFKSVDFEGSDSIATYSNVEEAEKHTDWLRKRIETNEDYADRADYYEVEVLDKFNEDEWING